MYACTTSYLPKARVFKKFNIDIAVNKKLCTVYVPSNHLMSSYFLHKTIFFSIICEDYPMVFL
jgi:hypothetical protein